MNRFKLQSRQLLIPADAAFIALAWVAAYGFRFNFALEPEVVDEMVGHFPALIALQLLAFVGLGLYNRILRYAGLPDLMQIVKAVSLGTLLFALWVGLRHQFQGVSRSTIVLQWMLLIMALGASRVAIRVLMESGWLRKRVGPTPTSQHPASRAVIYGAGQAGELLVREMRRSPDLGYTPVAFVDDHPGKSGLTLHDLKVHPGKNLEEVARRTRAEAVIVAIPSADGPHMRQILERCAGLDVIVRTLPPAGDLLTGRRTLGEIREVAIDDLLGRKVVRLDTRQVEKEIRDARVLVTGAGGSIGSELCRQLARYGPSRLIMVDRNENALVKIDLEIGRQYPKVLREAVLVDVANGPDLERIMHQLRPQRVYHAAAYKHVPILETNVARAVTNNIGGTIRLAQICRVLGVERMVLISTDKAVAPSNVMGATKRVGERIMQAMAQQEGPTRFTAVRFGNVLGSDGSVVPLFQEQIRKGGPVTVTHPEMTRFFMTIPEATGLVLQASLLGSEGDLFVLDMGKPVRILDLARDVIKLSGFIPEEEIAIEFTGVRPGEKLHEALTGEGERLEATEHPKIQRVAGQPDVSEDFWIRLRELIELSAEGDDVKLREALLRLTPEAQQVVQPSIVTRH